MKKIMFNDRFGLTDAVLQGRKTMTRRIARFDETERPCQKGRDKCLYCQHYDRENGCTWLLDYSPYKVGEVVAVAQAGKEIYNQLQQRYGNTSDAALGFMEMYKGLAMWRNKMFVPADLCPNKICITDIKVERLQYITEYDAHKEGICYYNIGIDVGFTTLGLRRRYGSARSAFAALIDKISGKGTWERNPYVFAYTFELLK